MATNGNGNGDDYSIFSPEFSTNSLSATGFKIEISKIDKSIKPWKTGFILASK